MSNITILAIFAILAGTITAGSTFGTYATAQVDNATSAGNMTDGNMTVGTGNTTTGNLTEAVGQISGGGGR